MPITIRLSAEEEIRLNALSTQTGRTKSFYIKQALAEHLDDMEDLYLAEKELIQFRSGQSQAAPLEEVMKRYEVAN